MKSGEGHRIVHYRLEGKHARPLCGCKLPPGVRPRLLPRLTGVSVPPPADPNGAQSGTCARCYELAQGWLSQRSPLAITVVK